MTQTDFGFAYQARAFPRCSRCGRMLRCSPGPLGPTCVKRGAERLPRVKVEIIPVDRKSFTEALRDRANETLAGAAAVLLRPGGALRRAAKRWG